MSSAPPPKDVPQRTSSNPQDSRRRKPDPVRAGSETPTSASKETHFDRLLATQSKYLKSVAERTRSGVAHTPQAGPSRSPFPSPKRPRTNEAADTKAGPSARTIPAARDAAAAASPSTRPTGALTTSNAAHSFGGGGVAASSLTGTEIDLLANILPKNMSSARKSAAASSLLGRAISIPDEVGARSQSYTLLNPPRRPTLGKTANMTGIPEPTNEQQKAQDVARGKVNPPRVPAPYDKQRKRDEVYRRFNAGESYRKIETATGVPRGVLPNWMADGIADGRVAPEVTLESPRSYEVKRKQAHDLFKRYKEMSLTEVSRMTGSSLSMVTEWKRMWTAKAVVDPEISGSKNSAGHDNDKKKAQAYALLIHNKTMTLKEASMVLGIPQKTLIHWKTEDLAAGNFPPELDPNRLQHGRDPEKVKEVESLLRQDLPVKEIVKLTGISFSTVKRWRKMATAGESVIPETSGSAGRAALAGSASSSSDAPQVSRQSSDVLLYTPKNMLPYGEEVSSESSAWANGSGLLR